MGNVAAHKVLAFFGLGHSVPRITKLKYTNFPRVDTPYPLEIEIEDAGAGHITMTHADGKVSLDTDLPLKGIVIVILISVAPVTIVIRLDPILASADVIDPVFHTFTRFVRDKPPWFFVWWASLLLKRVGEEGLVRWWGARNAQVLAEVVTGSERTYEPPERERAVSYRHAFLHRFTGQGRVLFCFFAKNEHSATKRIKAVRVRPRAKPRVKVEATKLCGRVGNNVSFVWAADKNEVSDAWIEVLATGERHKVPVNGEFTVKITHQAQEFILSMRGEGGVTRVRLTAMPWIGLENNHP